MSPNRGTPAPYTPKQRTSAPALEVRDRRSKPFVMLDKGNLHAILRSTFPGRPALIAAYVALIYVADNKTGEAIASIEQLAELAGQSVRSLQTKLEQLHQLGLISIDSTFVGGRQTRNTYTLQDAPLHPPAEPPQRGRLIIAPAISPATAAPLNAISPATVAPPSPATVAPLTRKRRLEGDRSMNLELPRARARATSPHPLEAAERPAGTAAAPAAAAPPRAATDGRTDGRTDDAPPTYRSLAPALAAAIARDFLERAQLTSVDRAILPPFLAGASWERADRALRLTTTDARTARICRQHAGSLRLAAAKLLTVRSLELDVRYQDPRHG